MQHNILIQQTNNKLNTYLYNIRYVSDIVNDLEMEITKYYNIITYMYKKCFFHNYLLLLTPFYGLGKFLCIIMFCITITININTIGAADS